MNPIRKPKTKPIPHVPYAVVEKLRLVAAQFGGTIEHLIHAAVWAFGQLPPETRRSIVDAFWNGELGNLD